MTLDWQTVARWERFPEDMSVEQGVHQVNNNANEQMQNL